MTSFNAAGDFYQPFANDAELLQAFLVELSARSRLMVTRRELLAAELDMQLDHQLDRRSSNDTSEIAEVVYKLEKAVHRLAGDRQLRMALGTASGSKPLGVQSLIAKHDLSEDEVVVVLALSVMALGDDVTLTYTQPAFRPTCCWSVGAAIDQLCPADLADHIRYRRIFHSDGRLRSAGLISVNPVRTVTGPCAFMDLELLIAPEAVSTIFGAPAMSGEVQEGYPTK